MVNLLRIISALAMFGAFSWAFKSMTGNWASGLLIGGLVTALLMMPMMYATRGKKT